MSLIPPPLLKQIKGGLIVSCQAARESPLHDPHVISAMALAAHQGGAVGVRIDSPEHIRAVRSRGNFPIIGLWKKEYSDSAVYITPTLDDARAVAQSGADIIAVDATNRDRPQGETLADMVEQIHAEFRKPVLADIDDLETALWAENLGVDAIATTLHGYTENTEACIPPNLDLLRQIIAQVSVPVILEGGVHTPEIAKEAIALGAWAVVVGQDITGIDHKIGQYCQQLATLRTS